MRRLVVTSTVLALSTVGLAACGDTDSTDTGKVSVSGAFGTAPKVTYDGTLVRDKTEVKVLTKGTGDTVKEGDSADIEYYIGNGFSGKKAISSFDEGHAAETLTFTKGKLLGAFQKGVVGQKVGSRVEVIAAPDDAFGPMGGNAELGIGNHDTVVFVIDIVSKPLSKPEGKTLPAPAGAPKLQEKDGVPSGFDFKGMTPVGTKPVTYTLIEGTGPALKKGQQVTVNYLGQVVGGEVFDASYSKGTPFGFALNAGAVIKGWVNGLQGVKVGSRVIIVIPSAWGYGTTGSGDKIKPGDDLVFVVDVLGAS